MFYRALIRCELVASLCTWEKIRLLDALCRLLWVVGCSKFRIHCVSWLVNSLLRIDNTHLFVFNDRRSLELKFILVADDCFSTAHLLCDVWMWKHSVKSIILGLDTHVRCVFFVAQCGTVSMRSIHCPSRLNRWWNLGCYFLLLVLDYCWDSLTFLL